MLRVLTGADEVRFSESGHAAGESAAALLPIIRERGKELTGSAGPASVHVVIAADPPGPRDWFRPSRYWLMLIIVNTAVVATLAWGWTPAVLPVLTFYWGIPAWSLAACARRVRAGWPFASGFAIAQYPMFRPVILVQWPRPESPPWARELRWVVSNDAYLQLALAHEYGHVILNDLRKQHPPPWLDEGFAFWFSEEVTGVPFWRPESRVCVSEPEPKGDPRADFGASEEVMVRYYRLMARYYWEVRALAEEGRLAEALTASRRKLGEMRPRLAPDS